MDGLISVFSFLPKNAAEIYSNFGENWIDFKTNLEGNCEDNRHCILSGENQIKLLRSGLRLQVLICIFDSILLNTDIIDNITNDNNNNNINNINSNSNHNGTNNNNNNDKNIINCERTNFIRNLHSFALTCVRATPLIAVAVRTSLFFGSVNQR